MKNERHKKTIANIENQILLYSASLVHYNYWLKEITKLKPILKNKLSEDDFKSFENQLNFGGYLDVSILDLLTINKNFILSKYVWEYLHQIRLAYLLIYALIETYDKHSPQLKLSSKRNITLKNLFLEITAELKSFKKQNGYPNKFTEIRNLTIGHIDQNLTNVYEIIFEIDHMKAYQTIIDFLLIVFKIHKFATENVNTLEKKIENDFYSFNELTNNFEKRRK